MNKIAIYPGTFDPITFGHIDVIKKGIKLFDKIIVAVSDVDNKDYLFNSFETPWEGSRVCKKKNLNSIDFMRQKVRSKNLKYNFLRFDKEKNIEIFENGGWHFNNIMKPEKISLKLKTFAHSEFSEKKFSDVETIRSKIKKKIDLFDRGHQYKKVELDSTFPKYLVSFIRL